MRKTRVWAGLCFCVGVVALFAVAQSTRKAGLWEMTTTTTWQQSPFPANTPQAPGSNSPSGAGPHTTQVCVSQEMLDRYGAILPQSRGNCQVANLVKDGHRVTADWMCTGAMSGKGSMESSWSDAEHAKGKVHFVGTMQMGPTSKPIEWTSETTAVFKSADCGSVKPLPMPSQ